MIWKLNETNTKIWAIFEGEKFFWQKTVVTFVWRVAKLNHFDGVYYRLIAMERKIAKLMHD